ncbi:hypothetical protein V12B01_12970 [Vibrio splendidus 12B01]|nr:hypothetical protein V12B01_12970 [Vibrio splendidus 12B01]
MPPPVAHTRCVAFASVDSSISRRSRYSLFCST